MTLRKWGKEHPGEGCQAWGKRDGGHIKGEVLAWLTPMRRGAARFTSEVSNYACRKLGFEEDNAEIALHTKMNE